MKASATNEGHIARLGLLPWRCHGDQEGSNYRPGCAAGGGEPRRLGRSYGSGGRNQVHWAARLLTSTSHAIPSMV